MTLAKTLFLAAILGIPNKDIVKPRPSIQLDGYVSAYNEQPTIHTLAYRRSVGDIPHLKVDGYVATLSCDYVGKEAILETSVGNLNVVVFDCAGADGGHSWMRDNNMVVEIDYYLWRKYPDIVGEEARLIVFN
jgi:hypothetical protein